MVVRDHRHQGRAACRVVPRVDRQLVFGAPRIRILRQVERDDVLGLGEPVDIVEPVIQLIDHAGLVAQKLCNPLLSGSHAMLGAVTALAQHPLFRQLV